VRITAQLIQASTDQHLWAESYQRDLRGVLALQGEIATAIADKVRAAVTPTERARLASARPVNPVAYEAYLKGMQSCYRLIPQDIDTGLDASSWRWSRTQIMPQLMQAFPSRGSSANRQDTRRPVRRVRRQKRQL